MNHGVMRDVEQRIHATVIKRLKGEYYSVGVFVTTVLKEGGYGGFMERDVKSSDSQ